MKFTKEDIEFIEKAIEIRNKGYYMDGGQLTTVYNRVLEKNVNVTNCGSCLRGRITELEDALRRFKSLAKQQETEETKNDTQEENKPAVEPNNEADKADKNEVIEEKKRVGRPKKN